MTPRAEHDCAVVNEYGPRCPKSCCNRAGLVRIGISHYRCPRTDREYQLTIGPECGVTMVPYEEHLAEEYHRLMDELESRRKDALPTTEPHHARHLALVKPMKENAR